MRALPRRAAAVAAAAAVLLGVLAPQAVATGRLVFAGPAQLELIDAGGGHRTPIPDTTAGQNPVWSPDAARIAFIKYGALWVVAPDGTGLERITDDAAYRPSWSPDGTEIAFSSNRDGGGGAYSIYAVKVADHSVRRITGGAGFDISPTWSPDGATIAFVSRRTGEFEIWTVGAGGGTPAQLTTGAYANDSPNWHPGGGRLVYTSDPGDYVDIFTVGLGPGALPQRITNYGNSGAWAPAFSPGGGEIVFVHDDALWRVPSSGGTAAKIPGSDKAGPPDWEPQPDPIVFVHGFAGSRLYCDGAEAWPRIPLGAPKLAPLRLAADGRTDAGGCTVSTAEGDLVLSAGSDVYGSTVRFLQQAAPGRVTLYAWDWRKSPADALAGLDLAVERARCGGTLPPGTELCPTPGAPPVAIVAHSMGGLVTRWYVGDAARATKVSRVLTVGTPYWGSPKAFFPLAAGVESPGMSALDAFLDDDEFRDFARNLAGEYFLWPSAPYGPWLSVQGRTPETLDTAGVLAQVWRMGGNDGLLSQALAAHETTLDGFAANGTDYRVIVGTGIPTIDRVRWRPGAIPLLDRVEVWFASGDGTVPARSGTQGPPGTPDPLGDNVPIRYACNISHVPLPGAAPVTDVAGEFITDGKDFKPGLESPCAAAGSLVEIYNIGRYGSTAGIRVRARAAAQTLTLREAEEAGLIQAFTVGGQTTIVADADTPVTVTLDARRTGIVTRTLQDENRSAPSFFGPVSGPVQLRMGAQAEVLQGGRKLTPVKADLRPPAIVPLVRPAGRRVRVTFPAADPSGTALVLAAAAKAPLKPVAKSLTTTAARLPTVRFAAADRFGNALPEQTLLAVSRVRRAGQRTTVTIGCPKARRGGCRGTITLDGRRYRARTKFRLKPGAVRTLRVRSRRTAPRLLSATVHTTVGRKRTLESRWQGRVG